MDTLVVGGKSAFLENVVDKFNKEGHRVYVLSGDRFAEYRIKKAFEQYNFNLDADVMPEIIESIHPQCIVFMGAYDTGFYQGDGNSVINYSAGVMNVLNAATKIRNMKIVYLSSQEVYSTHSEENITEETHQNAKDLKGVSIAQGEDACLRYASGSDMDAIVLRLDHVCPNPKEKADVVNRVSSMCVDYMKNGKIFTSEKKDVFSLLSANDAVEYIHMAAVAKEHALNVYNISSAKEIDEERIAEIIVDQIADAEHYEKKTDKQNGKRIILDNTAFFEEFHTKAFKTSEDVVVDVVTSCRKNRKALVDEIVEKKGFWKWLAETFGGIFWALLPFIENIVAFIPFFMLNNRATGSDYFQNLDFFLLYVLLFAIIYGQQQATFSALLATMGYLFRQMYSRSGFEVVLDYNTYVWIAQLFILGLVVGHMRDKLKVQQEEEESEAEYLHEQIEDIATINTSNLSLKSILETQIINQDNSLGKVYEITSGLDKYEPEEVLFYAAEVVGQLIKSKDVAIYTVANGDYARLFSATSDKARSLGNSIKYTDMTEVYEDISKDKVYINRALDERYPLMADAIFAEEKMELIIMVWGIPWEFMNLGQANMLRVAGLLIQNSTIQGNRYMAALEEKRYVSGTSLLENEAFSSLLRAYIKARDKGLTECCVLEIDVENEKAEEAGTALSKKLRQSDFIGFKDSKLYALLSNTSKNDADFVIDRFFEVGYRAKVQEDISL